MSVVFVWHVSLQKTLQANAQVKDTSCRLLSGISGYASDPDSGVVDFDYGDYAAGEDRAVDGILISDDDKVCVPEDSGAVIGYAWNPNAGWLQMDWCLDGKCTGLGQVKMDSSGVWSGYAWSDEIGWVWFDWECSGVGVTCDITSRVHTDLTSGAVQGYAWNDHIGWIAFGGGTVMRELSEVSVKPIVIVTPDPLKVTKYGLGPDPLEKGVLPIAPFASGEDDQEYVVIVQLYDTKNLTYLSGDNYDVTVKITPKAGSFVCYDQIDQACRDDGDPTNDTEAIFSPEDGVATYNVYTKGWEIAFRSYAPTSEMNGYDDDGDGVIDFYFDIDLTDPEALIPSDSTNHFAFGEIALIVTPKKSAPNVVLTENNSLFNLDDELVDDEEYTLKFAPAIEVTNLERVQSSTSYTPYMDRNPVGKIQTFKGLVARWVEFPLVRDGFDVKAVLEVDSETFEAGGSYDLYSFLFDRDGDGDFTSTYMDSGSKDSNEIVNRFIISGTEEEMTAMCVEFEDFDNHTDRYVPGTCADGIVTLESGSPADGAASGVLIGNAMMVGIGGGSFSSPRYMTRVIYDVDLQELTTVKYRSNYLPQPSSETGYQENITVSGSVTSTTGQATDVSTVSGDDIVVIGDIATIAVRNELFRRFSEYTKGVTPESGSSAHVQKDVSGNFKDKSGKAVELLDGKMLYFKDVDEVKIEADGMDEPVIVNYGGDIFIDTNLTNVGLVAFKNSDGEGGNIYIHVDITDLENVYVFAEGSVFSYSPDYDFTDEGYMDWGDSDTRAYELINQLFWKGSLVSQNTIFGAESGILPDGTEASVAEATEYDLNELREFTLCWKQIDVGGAPVDYDEDGETHDGEGNPDLGDVEDCPGAERSMNISDPTLDYYNAPAYFEYTPPPSDLSLLGESQAGSLNVF